MNTLLQLMTLLVAFCNPQNIHAHEQGMTEKHNNPSGESFKQRVALRQDKGLAPRYGKASWYGEKFHGKPMKNGKLYNMYKISVAYRMLPQGSFVRVTNQKNGRYVIAEVTDTGGFQKKYKRLIDLSYKAAQVIDAVDDGVVPVKVEVVSIPRST